MLRPFYYVTPQEALCRACELSLSSPARAYEIAADVKRATFASADARHVATFDAADALQIAILG